MYNYLIPLDASTKQVTSMEISNGRMCLLEKMKWYLLTLRDVSAMGENSATIPKWILTCIPPATLSTLKATVATAYAFSLVSFERPQLCRPSQRYYEGCKGRVRHHRDHRLCDQHRFTPFRIVPTSDVRCELVIITNCTKRCLCSVPFPSHNRDVRETLDSE